MSKRLPQISSDIPRDLRVFTDRLRELISADGEDRFVTAKELATAGVVKIERGGAVSNPQVSVNLPPAPQNVTVVGNIQTIVISWAAPNFEGFSLAEIWGNNTNDVNTAHKVGTSPGIEYRDPVGPLSSKYYWVRFLNTANQPGPFASAQGQLGTTSNVVVYTSTDLQNDLASGAVQVVAGALNSNSIIKTAPTYMSFQHKDASILGTTAAYSGDYRTALGITSTGIIAGYNSKTTGVWQTTLAIEAATGNLTVLGTIKANSVIQVGAYLGTDTVSTVLGNISTANSNAASALSQVSTKLTAQATYILGSDFSLKTSTYDAGSGIIITNTGILGKKSGTTTFAIDNAGNATFSGDIVTSGKLQMSGVGFTYGGSVSQNTVAYIDGTASIYGIYAKGGGLFTTAIYGESTSSGGSGVTGSSTGIGRGVYGYNDSTGTAVLGINVGSGAAVSCSGPFRFGSYTISVPDGGTDKYLRNDGTWAPVSGVTSGVSSFNSRTGAVSLSSGDVTGALGYTPYNSSNPSGYITSSALSGYATLSTTSLSNYSTTSVTLAYLASFGNSFSATCTYPGVGFTVSGSGTNNVGYTIFQTSDRSLKRDIQTSTLGMDFIRQLQPVTYYYADNNMFGFTKKMYGLIANDVLAVAGEESSLVYTTGAGPLEGKLASDYASYIAPIITALKEIDVRLTQLENKDGS